MFDLEYVEKLKEFWELKNIDKAKYEKILITKDIKKGNKKQRDDIWNKLTDKHIEILLDDIMIKKDWKLLDIGCGIGRLIEKMLLYCNYVDGVDISETMIKNSKQYLKKCKNNGDTYVNSGYDLSLLQSNYYDFVYSIITFQHIKSQTILNNYFNEVHRVLKPKSYFKFQIRKETNDEQSKTKEPCFNFEYKFRGNFYKKTELKRLLKSNNFKINYINETDNGINYWVLASKE